LGTIGSKWLTIFKRNQAPGIAPIPTNNASSAEPATGLILSKRLDMQPIIAIGRRPTPQQSE
jgi:hypothetical protein